MSKLPQLLKSARPRLRDAAPLTYSICLSFAIANFSIGLGFYFLYTPTVPVAVINYIFTAQVWGAIFIASSLVSLYGLTSNRWNLVRQTIILQLAIKATWTVALVIRVFHSPNTIIFTIVWLTLASIQAATYIYFIPSIGDTEYDR